MTAIRVTGIAACLLAMAYGAFSESQTGRGSAPRDESIVVDTGAHRERIEIPVPPEMHELKTATYIDIRDGYLFVPDIHSIRQHCAEVLEEAAREADGNTPRLLSLLHKRGLETDGYTIDMTYVLLGQIALKTKPATSDCPLGNDESIAIPRCIENLVESMDPEEERIVLFLRQEPTPAVEKLTGFIRTSGIHLEVQRRRPDDMLKFGLGGSSRSSLATSPEALRRDSSSNAQ